MKTKAVYVVVSSDSDIYFEQAWVSAWSLKHYNPDMWVECVVDQDTYQQIQNGYRKGASSVIDKFVCVNTPNTLSKKETSRWLKTKLRKLVDGDFLFIDTDTIVCDKLDDIDAFDCDVMMVPDSHCPLSQITSVKMIQDQCMRIAGRKLVDETYFNSGVIYCKDTPKSHQLYDKWHSLWQEACKKGVVFDQKPLALIIEGTDYVQEMSGIYNCQVRFSVQYLADAKILHFYSDRSYYPDYTHPFFGVGIYQKIKELQEITDEIKALVLHGKSLFIAPTLLIGRDELDVRNSRAFSFLLRIRQHAPFYYNIILWLSYIQNRFLSLILKLKKNK